MLQPKVYFTERQIELISKESGLSKLEVTGVIGIMNKFLYSQESIAKWNYDERMGRHID